MIYVGRSNWIVEEASRALLLGCFEVCIVVGFIRSAMRITMFSRAQDVLLAWNNVLDFKGYTLGVRFLFTLFE